MSNHADILHQMAGKEPGLLANTLLEWAKLTNRAAQFKDAKGAADVLGLKGAEADAFEARVRESGMNNAELGILVEQIGALQLARHTKGGMPSAQLRLAEHMLNRHLEPLGFVMKNGQLMSRDAGRTAQMIDNFMKLPPKEKAKIIGGAAGIIAGIIVEPISTSLLAIGMVMGRSAGKMTPARAQKKMDFFNKAGDTLCYPAQHKKSCGNILFFAV